MQEVTVDVKNVQNALKIDAKVIEVAKDVVRNNRSAREKGKPRIDRDRWEKFKAFADALGLPHEDALKALEGNLDQTYISPAEITQRRFQILIKEKNDAMKALHKAKAYVQSIVDSLINDVGRIQPTPFKPSVEICEDTAETWAMLDISDWHDGSNWSNEETGFGDMSSTIIGKRVEILTNKVVGITNLQRRIGTIKNICVNMLGDFGESDSLHPGSAIHVDSPNIVQVRNIVNNAERMFKTFLQEFEEVHVRAVRGNHGRMGAKGEQHDWNNWDNLCYYFLAERFAGEPRLRFQISTMPFMAYILPGQEDWVHCIMHGDKIPSSLSIPFYGISRAEQNIVKLLDRSINFTHIGHFHTMSQLDRCFGATICNGSLVGTSPYGISLMLAGMPKQMFCGFHPELGQTWIYPIYLDKKRPSVPDENGIITEYRERL